MGRNVRKQLHRAILTLFCAIYLPDPLDEGLVKFLWETAEENNAGKSKGSDVNSRGFTAGPELSGKFHRANTASVTVQLLEPTTGWQAGSCNQGKGHAILHSQESGFSPGIQVSPWQKL